MDFVGVRPGWPRRRRIPAPALLASVAMLLCLSAPAATAAPAPKLGHVFVIVGENTSTEQITPAHAPYLTRVLKPRAAWVTSYRSFAKSSSLGQYMAMTSGRFSRCEANNDLPDKCHQARDNIFSQLDATHRSWFQFTESADHACDIVDHGAAWSKDIHSAHHDPAIYYTQIHGRAYDEAITPKALCRAHDVPMGSTAPNDTAAMDHALATGAVGDLNLLIPNDCENGHDLCGTHDRIRQFDDFLAREVPKIEASPAFGSNGTIIITWDEGSDPPLKPTHVLLAAVGPLVAPGVVSAGQYDHYSLLRTLQDGFGVPALAQARHARALPIFAALPG